MADSTDPAIDPIWRAGYAAGYEAGKASEQKFDLGWGRPCGKCGQPVYPPTNRYMKAAVGLGDQIWHGDCVLAGAGMNA